jgi:hypothetical protein
MVIFFLECKNKKEKKKEKDKKESDLVTIVVGQSYA